MRRPNILLLYTDQQRWDALGANGNGEIRTPHLDRLAADSVNFDHCFVQNPVCMPSRVSFLTGRYPSSLGISHMGVPVPPDTVTLPRLLRGYGYTSGQIGKLHFLPHANRDHRKPHPDYGFDHLEISDEPGSYHAAYRAWVAAHAPDQLDHVSLGEAPSAIDWKRVMDVDDGIVHPEERFPKRPLGSRSRSDMTNAAFVAEQTMEFIGAHEDGPFLCVSGFYSPHSPWVAPQEFLDLYDPAELTLPTFPAELEARRGDGNFSDEELRGARQGYYAMVSEVDHHVGRILDHLDERGVADNTIVVFASDHGACLPDPGHSQKWPMYDQITRIPLIVSSPGRFDAGRAIDGLCQQMDLGPAILELAGAEVPEILEAESLLPALENKEWAGRDYVFAEQARDGILTDTEFMTMVRSKGSIVASPTPVTPSFVSTSINTQFRLWASTKYVLISVIFIYLSPN